jgi:hypothetical protein
MILIRPTNQEERQKLKLTSNDGLPKVEFIESVKKAIRCCEYDSETNTFYMFIEYQDGTWRKITLDTETLERIAMGMGYFGEC